MIYKPSIYTSLLRKTTTHHLGVSVNTIKQNVKVKFKRAPAYLLSLYFNVRGSFGGKNRLTTYYKFFKCIFLPHPPSDSFHAGIQNVSSIKGERPKLQTYILFFSFRFSDNYFQFCFLSSCINLPTHYTHINMQIHHSCYSLSQCEILRPFPIGYI